MAETDFLQMITKHIDGYLDTKSKSMEVGKTQLSIYMSVKTEAGLTNLLYQNNEKYICTVSIRDVVGPMINVIAGGSIRDTIVEGFKRFAGENQMVCDDLKLLLYYNNKLELIYQGYYQNKPIEVDLVNFFKK